VVFPDLPGLISAGDDYADTLCMAHEGLAAHIKFLEELSTYRKPAISLLCLQSCIKGANNMDYKQAGVNIEKKYLNPIKSGPCPRTCYQKGRHGRGQG